MRCSDEDMRKSALRLLTWLPCVPCGVTLSVLALDCEGCGLDPRVEQRLLRRLDYLERRMGVVIQRSRYGRVIEYWLGGGRTNRLLVDRLVGGLVSPEGDLPCTRVVAAGN